MMLGSIEAHDTVRIRTCRSPWCWLGAVAIAFALSLPCSLTQATAQNESNMISIVADQVRSQGFACDSPVSAERIEAQSSAGENVYLLKCDGATYRVRLIPDQAAEVVKVE